MFLKYKVIARQLCVKFDRRNYWPKCLSDLSMSSHEVDLWGLGYLTLQSSYKSVFPKPKSLKWVFFSFSGRGFLFPGACGSWAFHLELLLAAGPAACVVPAVWRVPPDPRELEGRGARRLLQGAAAALAGPAVCGAGAPPHLWICCEIAPAGSGELSEWLQ